MKKKKILLIYINYASFVKVDHEILSKNCIVKRYQFKASKNIGLMLIEYIKQFFFLLSNLRSFDLVYCWFADYHTILPIFFAKIFGKKSSLVLGGYDVTYVEKINYGSFNNSIRAFCASYAMKNASLNLPVCDNIMAEALERVPQAKTKLLYTGYSYDKFSPNFEKQSFVLTVAIADNEKSYFIKNIDFFLSVVEAMPETKFIMIGLDIQFSRNIEIPNLTILERIPQDELIEYYQKASVYVQFSLREGLPNSVCEAMLCGCIPVGSNNGGIPTAIGNCGYIIDSFNVDSAVQTIEKALDSTIIERKAARQYIFDNFSLERRENELLNLIENLL
jgi:glycosyltransferase involved in cell wall biosynthesis